MKGKLLQGGMVENRLPLWRPALWEDFVPKTTDCM